MCTVAELNSLGCKTNKGRPVFNYISGGLYVMLMHKFSGFI